MPDPFPEWITYHADKPDVSLQHSVVLLLSSTRFDEFGEQL